MVFFIQLFFWICRLQCWQPSWKKTARIWSFHATFQKKTLKSSKKFSRKCPYWHVQGRFVNPVWIIITKGGQFFAHCPQLMRKFFFKNKFLSNFYCKHVACSFENPAGKKLPEMREQLDRRPKISETIAFFSSENFCSENFLTCMKHFSEPRLKRFDKNRLVFAPCPKMIDIFVFWKKPIFSSILPNGHVRSRFHSPAGKSPTGIVWLKIPKNEKRFNSLNFFSENVFVDTYNAVLTTPLKKYR